MSKRSENKKEHAREQLAHWYKLKPIMLALPLIYLLGMIIAPLLRGQAVTPADLGFAALKVLLTALVALLIAWVPWRFVRRRNWLPNTVFGLVVGATAVWTVVLSDGQRADASAAASSSLDHQVANLKQAAHRAID